MQLAYANNTLDLTLTGVHLISGKNGTGKTQLCDAIWKKLRENSENGYLYCDSNRLILNKWASQPQVCHEEILLGLKEIIEDPKLKHHQLFQILEGFLRENGFGKNTVVILDRPDMELHPEQQLTLATLLLSMVRNLDICLVLTTMSPYLLCAMRAYVKLYDIENLCNYYYTTSQDTAPVLLTDGGDKIFKDLLGPLQKLQLMQMGAVE